MVFVEERNPGVRREFVEIHAREGVAVVKIGAVSFVQLQQQVGNLAEDLAAFEHELRVTDRRQIEPVLHTPFEPQVVVAGG